ncbi:hypothetical protein VMCG_09093 [Cytospora schulzeri]|uniref:Uncharacterized protein n=1 Tax=Cytospora schulzeri TaxID=448051 RepID=A0A423VPE8_9PEZI|nr:hypothetical protein VMCG_09093 [Valsa malicola]
MDALLKVEDTSLEHLRNLFEINTLSFVTLFQATGHLPKATPNTKGEGVHEGPSAHLQAEINPT